jgi:hypothetical protein
MRPRPPRQPLPRYVRRKWLRGEEAWGYFFEPPTWARAKGCPVAGEPLGRDYAAACNRAESVLLKQFDSWRSGGRSDLVPSRMTPGTFDWLAAAYKASERYTALSKSQRSNHDLGLGLVADHLLKDGRRFGTLQLRSITAAVADRIFEKLLVVDGRERRTTVNHAMKSCRRAWNVVGRAEPKLVPAQNPFARMGLKDVSKETPTADHAELLAFVGAADAGGLSSLGTAAMVAWEWLQREEHVFGAFLAEHYRPKDRPDEVLIVHPKTGEEVWIPLLDDAGARLFPELMDRLDGLKRGRIAGPLIVRDWADEAAERPVPWITGSGDLTYMRHRVKKIVRSAGLRDALTFASFRHGGMTELGDADLTDSQIRAISRHKSARTLPRYVKKTQRQIVQGTVKRRELRTNGGRLSE